jgi:uncharacterized protein YkwD
MARLGWLPIIALVALSLGGCPQPGADSGLDAPGGQTVGGANLAGDASQDPPDPFNARLAAAFPDCTAPGSVEEMRQTVFQLVNEARARAGLGPVTQNETLEQQATQYACELISYNFFAHVNPVTGSLTRVQL